MKSKFILTYDLLPGGKYFRLPSSVFGNPTIQWLVVSRDYSSCNHVFWWAWAHQRAVVSLRRLLLQGRAFIKRQGTEYNEGHLCILFDLSKFSRYMVKLLNKLLAAVSFRKKKFTSDPFFPEGNWLLVYIYALSNVSFILCRSLQIKISANIHHVNSENLQRS